MRRILICILFTGTLLASVFAEKETVSVDKLNVSFCLVPEKNKVAAFFCGETEVTQSLYEKVMGQNPSANTNTNVGENIPVDHVTWYDCIIFCNKLSLLKGRKPVYSVNQETNPSKWKFDGENLIGKITIDTKANGFRLLTNAEWKNAFSYDEEYIVEYNFLWKGNKKIVNGKVVKEYPNKKEGVIVIENNRVINGVKMNDEIAWHVDGLHKAQPVATKLPNKYGIYDMLGNVSEWVWDLKTDERFRYCRDTSKPTGGIRSDTQDSYREYPPFSKTGARGFRIAYSKF